LVAGDYTLTEVQPSGYRDVSNTAGSAGGAAESNKVSNITLAAGVVATNYLFGEVIGKLPVTGSDLRVWLTVSLGFVLVGGVLVAAGRRRRRVVTG
jgi:LPXTG-motif cell wall-anchored protein